LSSKFLVVPGGPFTGVTERSLYPGLPTWKKSPVSSQFGLLSLHQRTTSSQFLLNLHEEVAEATYIRPSSADFVVEIGTERNAGAAWGTNVLAVTFEAAIVAQVDAGGGALLDVGDRSGEGDACGEGGKDNGELHVEDLKGLWISLRMRRRWCCRGATR
jgi:hypothetical protein